MNFIKKIAVSAAVMGVLVVGMSSASAADAQSQAQANAQNQDQAHQTPKCDVAGKFCNTYFGQ